MRGTLTQWISSKEALRALLFNGHLKNVIFISIGSFLYSFCAFPFLSNGVLSWCLDLCFPTADSLHKLSPFISFSLVIVMYVIVRVILLDCVDRFVEQEIRGIPRVSCQT